MKHLRIQPLVLCILLVVTNACGEEHLTNFSQQEKKASLSEIPPITRLENNQIQIEKNLDLLAKSLASSLGNEKVESLVAEKAVLQEGRDFNVPLAWLIQAYASRHNQSLLPQMVESAIACGVSPNEASRIPDIAGAFAVEGLSLRPRILFSFLDDSGSHENEGWNRRSASYVGVGMFTCNTKESVKVWGKDTQGNLAESELPKTDLRKHPIWIITLSSDLSEQDEAIMNFFRTYNEQCTCTNSGEIASPEGRCAHNQDGDQNCGTFDSHSCQCIGEVSCTVTMQ